MMIPSTFSEMSEMFRLYSIKTHNVADSAASFDKWVLAYAMLQDQMDKLVDIDDPELGRAVMLAIEFLEELRG
mgnify:FL=1